MYICYVISPAFILYRLGIYLCNYLSEISVFCKDFKNLQANW